MPAFSHVGICVSDLDRALRFYCDGLGFERAERYDLDNTAAQLVACGGTLLENTRVTAGIALVFLADPDGTRVELMAR